MLHCFDPIRTLSFWAILVRLTLAVVCGGVIGAERETKRRPAGFRTHILICLGAAITTLVAGGIEVAEYTALQVKQAVVGNGHADKVQVQHMVRRLLSLPGEPSPDAADALACAIAHAHGGQGMGALATKGFRIRNGRVILSQQKESKE